MTRTGTSVAETLGTCGITSRFLLVVCKLVPDVPIINGQKPYTGKAMITESKSARPSTLLLLCSSCLGRGAYTLALPADIEVISFTARSLLSCSKLKVTIAGDTSSSCFIKGSVNNKLSASSSFALLSTRLVSPERGEVN